MTAALLWRATTLAPGRTHHLYDSRPLYSERFDEVLKFHEPGLAPVRRSGRAWHITVSGEAAYRVRFLKTFGFYEGAAAVAAEDGWAHIRSDGSMLYSERYSWCGNFQERRCAVRTQEGEYLHLTESGRPAYPTAYAYAGDFRDGLAVVQSREGRSTHVDREGSFLHGCWYLDLDVFHKGLARARDEGGWMHIGEAGAALYARRFAAVEPFYNGQARVERHDGGLEVIDERGNPLIELRPALQDEFSQLSADMVGFWRTYLLRTAAKLRALDALPGTVSQFAAACGLGEPAARRLLRALCELRLVERREARAGEVVAEQFYATSRGALLADAHPFSLHAAAQHWADSYLEGWRNLDERLRSHGSEAEASFFAQLADSPAQLATYHRMLRSYARHDYRAVAGLPGWSQHRHVIDAGGGTGALMELLLTQHPHLQGTLLERPEVAALTSWPAALAHRARVQPGDLFVEWPCHADAVCLAKVLHDWPDEAAGAILSHALAALTSAGSAGRLYIIEGVLSERSGQGGLLDLHMLISTAGRERTRCDFEALLAQAGGRLLAQHQLTRWLRVLVCAPASLQEEHRSAR